MIMPRDPVPGKSVDVYLATTSDPAIERAELRYTTDGTDPRAAGESARTLAFRPVHTEWDTLIWDYAAYWTVTIPAQIAGTMVTYCINAWTTAGEVIYADYPDAEERIQHATMIHFGNVAPDAPFKPTPQSAAPLFCYHVDHDQPPAWAQDAIIYHIFLDRFYPGDGADWIQTSDMQDFCGGTLWGLRDKLDYLSNLGINCLWLSPAWQSPTTHGYDVVDYDRIEPRLGGQEALHAVVEGAHKRGIRVLLDFVPNHLSNQHPIFLDAASGPGSPLPRLVHL